MTRILQPDLRLSLDEIREHRTRKALLEVQLAFNQLLRELSHEPTNPLGLASVRTPTMVDEAVAVLSDNVYTDPIPKVLAETGPGEYEVLLIDTIVADGSGGVLVTGQLFAQFFDLTPSKDGSSDTVSVFYNILRDGSPIIPFDIARTGDISSDPNNPWLDVVFPEFLDLPGPGSHTYALACYWIHERYTAGTASADGTKIGSEWKVTGSGTTWSTNAQARDWFFANNKSSVEIAQVIDNTELRTKHFPGEFSASTYAVIRQEGATTRSLSLYIYPGSFIKTSEVKK